MCLVVQRPYRAVAFQHDHPFIQHFNDGLLLLKEQPQAELFRDGVGRRLHHATGMVMVQALGSVTLSTPTMAFRVSLMGAAEQNHPWNERQ